VSTQLMTAMATARPAKWRVVTGSTRSDAARESIVSRTFVPSKSPSRREREAGAREKEVLAAAGIVVWPMVEFEADDALAAAAITAARDARVERVIICTPDKDLAQCVLGTRIVQLNRRTKVILDEACVVKKFGVSPASIPDYLALVGDASDGYPGLPGWGAKSSAAVLAKFVHLESIPLDSREWRVNVANATALAGTLSRERDRAILFRTLATLRTDIPLFDDIDQMRWNGPTPAFAALAARLDAALTETRRPVARRSLRAPIPRSTARL
jgi:5'-3' exonuclease